MQKIQTKNYNFTDKDLLDRLLCIKSFSKKRIDGKISDNEYMSFIEQQIKEVNFINRINDAKKEGQGEIEYG